MLSVGLTGLMSANSNNVLINKSDSEAPNQTAPNQATNSDDVELNRIVAETQPIQNQVLKILQWRYAGEEDMFCDRINLVFHLVFFIVDCSFGVFTFVKNPLCLKSLVPVVLCYTILHMIIPLIIVIANINKIVPGVFTYFACMLTFIPTNIAAEVMTRTLDESCKIVLHEQYPLIEKMLDVEIYTTYFCFASPIAILLVFVGFIAVSGILFLLFNILWNGYNALIERIQN